MICETSILSRSRRCRSDRFLSCREQFNGAHGSTWLKPRFCPGCAPGAPLAPLGIDSQCRLPNLNRDGLDRDRNPNGGLDKISRSMSDRLAGRAFALAADSSLLAAQPRN